jgi:hypothetical protein
MLRPVNWIVEHEAYPGHTIELPTARDTHDQADVVSVVTAPPIAAGSGRVVLGTFAHHDSILAIHIAGAAEPVESSPWHLFYSVNRGGWIEARDLRVGEEVRTKSGDAAILAIDQRPGTARVFDIEVEGDHAYYVAAAQVLTHNCDSWRKALGEGPEVRAMHEFTPNRNLASTQEESYFYHVRVDGEIRHGGITSVPPTESGLYPRVQKHIRALEKAHPDSDMSFVIRRTFDNREAALEYEARALSRFKRRFGKYPGEGLPRGNRINR